MIAGITARETINILNRYYISFRLIQCLISGYAVDTLVDPILHDTIRMHVCNHR